MVDDKLMTLLSFVSFYQTSAEVKGLEPVLDTGEEKSNEDSVPRHAENEGDMKPAIDDDVQLNLAKGCEELKSRLCLMDSKLREVRASEFRLSIMNVSFLVHVPDILKCDFLKLLVGSVNVIRLLSRMGIDGKNELACVISSYLISINGVFC